jgi:hypothetical protein
MSSIKVPRNEWGEFLRNFTAQHQGWRARIQTYDLQTNETVMSGESPLQVIELDLEDEKAPRINVVVEKGNKVIKYILYMPSQVIFSFGGGDEALHIESVNTSTTIHVRAAAVEKSADDAA